MTDVAPGSVLKALYWETMPDKYSPPKKFTEQEEARVYAERQALWLELVLIFAEGDVRIGADGTEDHPAAGDMVRRVQYQLQKWDDLDGPTTFPDRAAATAAAPPGRRTGLYQTLWIGPAEIAVTSTIGAVDRS